MSELNQSWYSILSSQQNEFIQSFLADNAPRYQRLIAPVGSGKIVVATLITQELVRKKDAKKILYLLPARIIVEQTKSTLEKLELGLPIEYVDLQRFREMITNVSLDISPWPKELLVLFLIDNAKSPDVLEAILKDEWDLIISISIGQRGNRSKIFEIILEKINAKRMLIIEDPGQSLLNGEVEYRSHGVVTTRWSLYIKRLLDSKGITLQLHVIDYERSQEEIAFIHSYIKLAEQINNTALNQFIRPRLVSSSLYSAEQSLRRFSNRLAHHDTFSFLNDSDVTGFKEGQVEHEGSSIQPRKEIRLDPDQISMEVMEALDALNRVPRDSKFDAFTSYIKYECDVKYVLVQSSYAATISYLSSSLNEERDDVYPITGSLSSDKVGFTLNKFRIRGGLLIASIAMLTVEDLELDELIYYDMHNNPALIRQNIACLLRHNQTIDQWNMLTQKKIVSFRDKTKAIPSEEKRLQQLQRIIRQLSQ
jgi:hypothetical protein